MKFRDKISLLLTVLSGHAKRYLRLVMIISIGSFFVYFVLISTATTKNHIQMKYHNTVTLIPFDSNSHTITDKPLISLNDLNLISNSFPGINGAFLNTSLETTVHHANSQSDTVLVVGTSPSNHVCLSLEIAELIGININDFLFINSYSLRVDEIKDMEFDILLPNFIYESIRMQSSPTGYISISNQSNYPMSEVLKSFNDSIRLSGYHYETQEQDITKLVDFFTSLISNLLTGVGLIVFIISTTNISTIMPFLIQEQATLIHVLFHNGLNRGVIQEIFMYKVAFILCTSLFISLTLSTIFSFAVFTFFKVVPFFPLIKILRLSLLQFFFGILLCKESTKKATRIVT